MHSHAIICDHVQSCAPTSVSSDSNKIAASADESAVRTDESAEVRTDESAAGDTSTIAVEGSAAAGEMAALAVGVTTPASTISTNASAATCGGGAVVSTCMQERCLCERLHSHLLARARQGFVRGSSVIHTSAATCSTVPTELGTSTHSTGSQTSTDDPNPSSTFELRCTRGTAPAEANATCGGRAPW